MSLNDVIVRDEPLLQLEGQVAAVGTLGNRCRSVTRADLIGSTLTLKSERPSSLRFTPRMTID